MLRLCDSGRMTAPHRQRLQIDERRTQLVALGTKLFAKRPYDDVSIDDIAAEAGISKGLLYHYFGSKRALYVETVREASMQLRARVEPDLSLSPAERARTGLEGYLGFVEEHAESFAALMRSGVGNDPEVAAVVDETRDAIIAQMMTTMGVDAARPIVRFVLRSWIGLVEAASLDWLARDKQVPRDVVVRMLIESLGASVMIATRLDPDSGLRVDAPQARAPEAAPTPAATKRAGRNAPARARTKR